MNIQSMYVYVNISNLHSLLRWGAIFSEDNTCMRLTGWRLREHQQGGERRILWEKKKESMYSWCELRLKLTKCRRVLWVLKRPLKSLTVWYWKWKIRYRFSGLYLRQERKDWNISWVLKTNLTSGRYLQDSASDFPRETERKLSQKSVTLVSLPTNQISRSVTGAVLFDIDDFHVYFCLGIYKKIAP